MASYARHGFGLCLVELRASGERDRHLRHAQARRAARARHRVCVPAGVLVAGLRAAKRPRRCAHARDVLRLPRLLAIVNPDERRVDPPAREAGIRLRAHDPVERTRHGAEAVRRWGRIPSPTMRMNLRAAPCACCCRPQPPPSAHSVGPLAVRRRSRRGSPPTAAFRWRGRAGRRSRARGSAAAAKSRWSRPADAGRLRRAGRYRVGSDDQRTSRSTSSSDDCVPRRMILDRSTWRPASESARRSPSGGSCGRAAPTAGRAARGGTRTRQLAVVPRTARVRHRRGAEPARHAGTARRARTSSGARRFPASRTRARSSGAIASS